MENRIKDFFKMTDLILEGAMDVALGSAATGVFTNSDWLWEQLHKVDEKRNPAPLVSVLACLVTNAVCVCVCEGQCCDR